jgi:hypothetical protein
LTPGQTGHAGQGAASRQAGQGSSAGQAKPRGSGGIWAQPASRMNENQANGARIMWVVYLEVGLALALAAFIVWFTWPKKRREDEENKNDDQ